MKEYKDNWANWRKEAGNNPFPEGYQRLKLLKLMIMILKGGEKSEIFRKNKVDVLLVWNDGSEKLGVKDLKAW